MGQEYFCAPLSLLGQAEELCAPEPGCTRSSTTASGSSPARGRVGEALQPPWQRPNGRPGRAALALLHPRRRRSTAVSGPSGKFDRRGRSLPNLPTTSEADLAGLKSNVRHTDACAGRYSSGILKSAFKKHRSGGKRHRLRSAIAAMRYEGPTRTLIAPDLFGAHIIHDRAARAWLGEDGGWTEFSARLNSNSQPAAELRVLPLETGDSLNTAFFKDNWVSL
jgi:hypothetical protein